MIRKPIARRWTVCLGVLSVACLIGLYAYLAHRQKVANPSDKTIPNWTQLKEGVKKATSESRRTSERWLVVDSKATVLRFFLGMGVGIVCSIIVGLAMGCFSPIEAFLYPPLALIAKLPPTAMLAVFFVMVGTGTNMYVAMIAFGVLPVLAQTVYLAVKDVPDEVQYKAYTLGASHAEVIWNVIVRSVLPNLIDAVRLQIGPAMVYLIAAELVVGDVGFGVRIRLQMRLLNMSVVFPYLALLATFGFAMDFALRRLQHFLCPWYTQEGN